VKDILHEGVRHSRVVRALVNRGSGDKDFRWLGLAASVIDVRCKKAELDSVAV